MRNQEAAVGPVVPAQQQAPVQQAPVAQMVQDQQQGLSSVREEISAFRRSFESNMGDMGQALSRVQTQVSGLESQVQSIAQDVETAGALLAGAISRGPAQRMADVFVDESESPKVHSGLKWAGRVVLTVGGVVALDLVGERLTGKSFLAAGRQALFAPKASEMVVTDLS